MGNEGVGSLMNNDHQQPVKLFKTPTLPNQTLTPPPCDKYAYMNKQAYPVCKTLASVSSCPNGLLNMDLAVTVSDAPGKASKDCELDNMAKDMDEQERRRLRKRLQNREAARKSKIRKKLELEELQAKVRAISSETSVLAEKIKSYSQECRVLKSNNKALLKELRNVFDEETMSRLESMNPCQRPPDVDPENSSQSQEASDESDRDADKSSNSD